jgi:lipoyl-dependent peroxiredoxin
MPTRTANARWNGSLQGGEGIMRMASGAYEGPYSFQSRFEEGDGTNPEELIAAAHAGCFTMALAFALDNAGFTANAIDSEAQLTLDQVPGGFSITAIHLTTRARVPNIDAAKFAEIAAGAKANCPVSKVLNATITLDATLAS